MNQSYRSAFTIVELLVVIVVIGVLASISLVAYTGVSTKATEAAVISDLDNTTKQFKMFQIENSGYPTTIDCAQPNSATNKCIKPSGSNTLGAFYVDNTVTPQIFCLTIKNGANIKKNINQDGVIADGACTYTFAGTLNAAASAPTRSTISLSWTAITSATSYTLQRSTTAGFVSTTTVYTGSSTMVTDTGLNQGTQYYYRVNVVVAGDTSAWATANNTTIAFPGPTNLAITSATDTSASFSWGAVSGAISYKLQRSTNASFTSPTDITGTATAVTSSGLASATTYYYRVNATDAGGDSGWSNTRGIIIYNSAGTPSWTVPSGVSLVQIEAWGSKGSDGESSGGSGGVGGLGGYAKGALAVSAGETLNIHVGSMVGGGSGGSGDSLSEYEDWCGWVGNGTWSLGAGGAGGGASDVRQGGDALSNRKIVAGGGGGGSGGSSATNCSSSSGAGGWYGGGTTGGGGGGTQSSGYALGVGGSGGIGAGGGGAGYYGGTSGSGGSGYVGGVTVSVLTAGNSSMPAPAGGTEIGHANIGFVRITF